MRQEARAFVAGTGIVGGIFGAVWGFIFLIQSGDTGSECFKVFRDTYSYNYRTPELNEIWADRKITIRECQQVNRIYEDLNTEEGRVKIDAEIRNSPKQTA